MHRAAATAPASSVWESHGRGRASWGKGHPRAPSTAGSSRTDSRSQGSPTAAGSPKGMRPLAGMLSSPVLFRPRNSGRCWGCSALQPGSSGCTALKYPAIHLQRGRASSSVRGNTLLCPLVGAILSFPPPLKYAGETCTEVRLLLPQG